MSADETVPYRDMLGLGLSARQVDYWTRQGYLKSVERKPDAGSGIRRYWPVAEQSIARLMVRLIAVGLSVEVAAKAAREAIESGATEIALADGVSITWEQVHA